MRIAIDGHPLVPPRTGIGQYTYHLITALARIAPANEYVVLYPRLGRSIRLRAVPTFSDRVRVVSEGRLAALWSRAKRKIRIDTPIERSVGAIDVYHATNYVFTHRVAQARRIVTIHDMTLMLFPEWHPEVRIKTMAHELTRSLEVADHILADSIATKNDIVGHFHTSAKRITVVPLAADESFRPLHASDTMGILTDHALVSDGYLLFVGTIEPRKNLLRLLQAVELAGHRIGPLVIVGADGWKGEEIARDVERLQRSRRVLYLGYVADAIRPALMNGARAFVYPSLYEGFGLPVLEAMACGVPVLTSNVASLPEVVGDAGVLVDPRDVDAIARGMVRLWEDDALRRELRRRGLERARTFSWDRTALETLSVYQRVE
jgi:glycosyltransferase involved in cell wall biosynthesis